MSTDNPIPLSRQFLLDRGYCCRSSCKNCPYDFNDQKESQIKIGNTVVSLKGSHVVEIASEDLVIKRVENNRLFIKINENGSQTAHLNATSEFPIIIRPSISVLKKDT